MDQARFKAVFRGVVLTAPIRANTYSLGLFLPFQDLEDVFTHWPELLEMDLRGNPVCKRQKYRELLITVCRSLGEIPAIFKMSFKMPTVDQTGVFCF